VREAVGGESQSSTGTGTGISTPQGSLSDTASELTGEMGGETGGETKTVPETQDLSTVVANELNIPVTELDREEGAEIISTTIGAISVEFPESIGKVSRDFTIPIRVKNPSPNPVYLETQAVLVEGIDRIRKKSFKEIPPRSESVLELYVGLPETYQNGAMTLRIEPQFAGSIRINPPSALIRAELVNGTASSWFFRLLPLVLLIGGILLAAIFAILIIFVLRRLQKNPGQAMAEAIQPPREEAGRLSVPAKIKIAETARTVQAAGSAPPGKTVQPVLQDNSVSALTAKPAPSPVPSIEEPSIAIRRANGRIMLSLFVQDQNMAIGKRNVHLMKAGHRLTVGGHNSDFLIFLVPVPHRIADVHLTGTARLIPRRSRILPDTGV